MQIYKLLLYKNEKNYIIKMEFCVITRKCLKNAYSKMYVTFAGECQNDFSRMLQDAIFHKRERRGKMFGWIVVVVVLIANISAIACVLKDRMVTAAVLKVLGDCISLIFLCTR